MELKYPGEVSQAAIDVLNERGRQIVEEGFDERHDDYKKQELLRASINFTAFVSVVESGRPIDVSEPPFGVNRKHGQFTWPWHLGWWKTKGGARRMLVKAAALIIAHIELMDRREKP